MLQMNAHEKAVLDKYFHCSDSHEDEDDAVGSDGLPIMLSRTRRADVTEYKGEKRVNIREWWRVKLTYLALHLLSACLALAAMYNINVTSHTSSCFNCLIAVLGEM